MSGKVELTRHEYRGIGKVNHKYINTCKTRQFTNFTAAVRTVAEYYISIHHDMVKLSGNKKGTQLASPPDNDRPFNPNRNAFLRILFIPYDDDPPFSNDFLFPPRDSFPFHLFLGPIAFSGSFFLLFFSSPQPAPASFYDHKEQPFNSTANIECNKANLCSAQ